MPLPFAPTFQPFLKADGELVACEYPVAHNESWEDPQALHVGLFYLAVLGLVAANVFFGSSYVVALDVSLVLGLVLLATMLRGLAGARSKGE